MTTEIIRQRHAAYHTTEHVIFELVARATGQQVLEREKIVRGYDSEVYLVRTSQGGEFVVRIHHHGGAPFEQEAWAIAQCRAQGVPAPEVLLLDTIGDELPREVMVQRRVPGRALSEIEHELTPEQRAIAWARAGAALGAIHSIKVGGFYKRHADGGWDFPDWATIAAQSLADRASEMPVLMEAGFSSAETELMLEIHKIGLEQFPIQQPLLCHGDFLPGHLFFDDQLRLRGVIDFGEFQGGGPVLEFANLSMSRPDIDLAWLQHGYGNQALFDATFPMQLLATKIGLQIGYLAHFIRQGNPEEAAPIAAGLRGSLREWEAYQ
ncbi:MAG TPA: aminoglycoside phosphotransferase family protein [Roseiflexaceae bacterium]|nr:aminoglycoside phosphotransferase family protein [Roseiflexaceae bacterium]